MVKITRIREYLIRDTSELAAVLGRLIRKRLWLNDHQWLRHYYVIITNLMIRILRDLIGRIRPDLFWRKDVISYSGRPPSRLDFLWYNEIIHHMVAFVVDESSRYDSLRNVRYRAISTMFDIGWNIMVFYKCNSYRALLRWFWSSRWRASICSLASSKSRWSFLFKPLTRVVSSSASSAALFDVRRRVFNFST